YSQCDDTECWPVTKPLPSLQSYSAQRPLKFLLAFRKGSMLRWGSLRMLSQYRVCLSSPVFRNTPSSTKFCKSLVAVALDVCDLDIILRTESAFEPVQSFPKHACQCFVLPFIELPSQAIIQPGFGNEKIDEALGVLLCFQNGSCEIDQPVSDVQCLIVVLKGCVIGLPVPADRLRQRDECRPAHALGQGLLRQRSPNPPIAVFKRVDRFEIQVCDTCPSQCR